MKIAIFQCAGGGLTPYQRFEVLAEAITDQDLDLVICPELFLSGYNVGSQVHELAETQDGPFAEKMKRLATEARTSIVYGFPELVEGTLYNSALCIDSGGSIVANHRKMVIPPGFEREYFTPADQLTLFELGGIKCAILICYDAEFPEIVRAAAKEGAQLIIVPTALVEAWPVVALKVMPTRAFENGVWLAYANHAGREGDATYFGASCIVSPTGQEAVRAGAGQELIVASIDVEAVKMAQARLPYLHECTKFSN